MAPPIHVLLGCRTMLTRSVQDAVVRSFSSISFPMRCTVTWVCLMALWAVWSLRRDKNTVSKQNRVCNHTLDHKSNTGIRTRLLRRHQIYWPNKILKKTDQLHLYLILFDWDVYGDCLDGIARVLIVPMWTLIVQWVCFVFQFAMLIVLLRASYAIKLNDNF